MLTQLANLATLAQASDPWADKFFGLEQDQRFVILIIGITSLTTIFITTIAITSAMYHTTRRRNLDAQLKRDMIDRGMSAEEIAQVMEAATPDGYLDRWAAARRKK